MLFEYAKFAIDFLALVGIVVVLCGITVSFIAFAGGFIFWLFEKAREEKTWKD